MHPVISTTDLAALLAGEPSTLPTVLDVRWRLGGPRGADSYRAGHLPGAVFVDLDTELAGPPGSAGRHPLPGSAALQRVLRAAGVRSGGTVVVYDDGDGSVAARAWWLLRWAGHEEVAVLDGGYAAWLEEGWRIDTGVPSPELGDIVVKEGGMPVLDADAAEGTARSGVLLDARAPQRYRGEVEPVDPRPGHIPGAVNAPFAAHTGEDGRWLAPSELAAHFAALGVTDDVAVGAYCGSGVTASSIVLALALAGRPEPAPLYPGSWSEWSADPGRPAVTGEEPG
ncbi:3-mercaptopyruvate sulfurtransferase [Prauserella marina]|uniref:Thiosulfate/3-mercaptopyruvate sulfurtransferase n=1 Tax=Prauserella marina TaxID=530584 RepID=A0A222W047_9PSEU|nr:sulfurtransferase [Prauserella marina]ASR39584.1 3-mercaptopyruvate sulfurtransferase [Prauserella marina]PWV74638.1 thiosulfate/3-mercaptopyruvate sulfurtransferase [Prauserella marina]SDD44633.1 thiosulfate/3-mercaptopyruvate sulfurtransferase [Prauserella marina]